MADGILRPLWEGKTLSTWHGRRHGRWRGGPRRAAGGGWHGWMAAAPVVAPARWCRVWTVPGPRSAIGAPAPAAATRDAERLPARRVLGVRRAAPRRRHAP